MFLEGSPQGPRPVGTFPERFADEERLGFRREFDRESPVA